MPYILGPIWKIFLKCAELVMMLPSRPFLNERGPGFHSIQRARPIDSQHTRQDLGLHCAFPRLLYIYRSILGTLTKYAQRFVVLRIGLFCVRLDLILHGCCFTSCRDKVSITS
jgi:hypothetical protein